jgi:hypothetical protein
MAGEAEMTFDSWRGLYFNPVVEFSKAIISKAAGLCAQP